MDTPAVDVSYGAVITIVLLSLVNIGYYYYYYCHHTMLLLHDTVIVRYDILTTVPIETIDQHKLLYCRDLSRVGTAQLQRMYRTLLPHWLASDTADWWLFPSKPLTNTCQLRYYGDFCFCFQVAEGVDTALALADLIRKIDKSYRIDLKYAIIFGGASIESSPMVR